MEPYQQIKSNKIILDEEEYIEKLEAIIQRDYFPDTLSTSVEDSSLAPASMSINKFFETYNSEDNQSFEILQENTMAEKRRKFHWLYETPGGKHAGMLMWYHQNGQLLTVEDRKKLDKLLECPTTVGDDRPNGPESWKFRVRNQLMFTPDLEASKDTCFLPSSDPSAIARLSSSSINSEEFSSHKNSNLSLIIKTPDGSVGSKRVRHNDRTLDLPPSENVSIKSHCSKAMPPPTIIPQNTRLSGSNLENIAQSPLEAPHTPSSFASDDENHSYRSVCMTPSPKPGTGSSQLNSPLITWGDICGTPNVLTSNSEINPFSITELSDRDKSVRLLEQRSQRHQKRNLESKSPSSRGSVSRVMRTPLTPAGSALAAKLYAGSKSDWGLSLVNPQSKIKKNGKTPRSDHSHSSPTALRTDDLLRL